MKPDAGLESYIGKTAIHHVEVGPRHQYLLFEGGQILMWDGRASGCIDLQMVKGFLRDGEREPELGAYKQIVDFYENR